jgi:hypothetical protein
MEGWNSKDIAVWVCQLMEARRMGEGGVEFEWYCCLGVSADGS